MTTNGMQLAQRAADLRRAGLRRATVSLDSLIERAEHLTRRDALDSVLRGIDAAISAFDTVKINTVVMRDFNDDELVDLIEYGKGLGAEIRFIEYMDVGGATNWSQDQVVNRREILARLEEHTAPSRPMAHRARRLPRAFGCKMERGLASLLRLANPFAAPVIAVASRPTACGISACTPAKDTICERSYARASIAKYWSIISVLRGKNAAIAALRFA